MFDSNNPRNKFAYSTENEVTAQSVDYIKQYTVPILRENSEWYIEFYAYDPEVGKLRRKKIKVNRIPKISERRKYCRDVIKRISMRLSEGWNPWIEQRCNGNLHTWNEAVEAYYKYLDKMRKDGAFRKDTFDSYKSYMKNVFEYNLNRDIPITYIYQFNRAFCTDVLKYIHIERNNSAQTRNNYLIWLRVFSTFLYGNGYLNYKPTAGITAINKRLIHKDRTDIPLSVITKISDYLKVHNKNLLLACYLLYYCCIRPKEMALIRISDFNLSRGTIRIKGENSKNHLSQSVTLTKKIIDLALDLKIFDYPGSYYLFSDKLAPGVMARDPKIFRDYWAKIKKPLGLKPEWKFYSLKDTGISEMLDKNISTISVKNQARHSNIAVTDAYLRQVRADADENIKQFNGSL